MPPLNLLQPPLQRVEYTPPGQDPIRLQVLRLDQINPLVSGNKWFKLKYNLQQARTQGQQTLLSFGGAWSNHLYALAAAARAEGFNSIGVVRGELTDPLNPVLRCATDNGMLLHPVSRSSYRLKHTPTFLTELRQHYGDFYLVPEGGSNAAGLQGCTEIIDLIPWDELGQRKYCLVVACGTGTTLAGLLAGVLNRGLSAAVRLIGVPVLKGGAYLTANVQDSLLEYGFSAKTLAKLDWFLADEFHGGGYARVRPELTRFMASFSAATTIPLEPVYTGKLFKAVCALMEQGRIDAKSEVIVIHSGGIIGEKP
ncbi:MAG: pyridoxal-phosphate dependent enzyme [Pseudomonadales bacterium]|nr:pyridoxal-phosphate dependent enzyme [Pseudomonadales bacterium]